MTKPSTTIAAAEVWEVQENGELLLQERMVANHNPNALDLVRNGSVCTSLVEEVKHLRTPKIISQSGHESYCTGKSCSIALPCCVDDQLRSVLVLCLQFSSEDRGGSEIWSRNERDELGLNEKFYANLGLIARISPYIKFPRAAGLPGQTWDTRSPKLIQKLESHPDFMRASAAKSDGLSTGIAIPFMHTEFDLSHVLVLLSAASSPLAHIFEIWKTTEDRTELYCRDLTIGPYLDWNSSTRSLQIEPGMDIAGKVFESQKPMLFDELPELRSKRGALAQQYDFRQAVSWPVFVGRRMDSIINLIL